VELLTRPRRQNLGGFTVRRVLPAARRKSVGPFVFFDEMGLVCARLVSGRFRTGTRHR
jgi:hypothetical protein